MSSPDGALHPHLQLVLDYLRAIEQNADEATLASFFAPGVRQREFPNRLLERGAERGIEQILEGSRKGRVVIQNQRYAVGNALVEGERVALELTWTGELKVPLGTLTPGSVMTAHCAVFFRIADGRIAEQHNFDCFEPF
jgi:hypothetical protein